MKTDLKKIPGVRENMKQMLIDIGIFCVEDLKGKDPEELYRLSCKYYNQKVDRCVLYVYKEAIYFAENEIHEQGKLKWWYWKDEV